MTEFPEKCLQMCCWLFFLGFPKACLWMCCGCFFWFPQRGWVVDVLLMFFWWSQRVWFCGCFVDYLLGGPKGCVFWPCFSVGLSVTCIWSENRVECRWEYRRFYLFFLTIKTYDLFNVSWFLKINWKDFFNLVLQNDHDCISRNF